MGGEQPDLAVHLADVLMSQLSDLEIDENKASEQVFIKDQIDVKILVIKRSRFCRATKEKPLPSSSKNACKLSMIACPTVTRAAPDNL